MAPVFTAFSLLFCVVTSSAGVTWEKHFDVPLSPIDEISCVRETRDSGYIAVGTINTTNATDVWILKVDRSGNIQWQKTLGGASWDYGSHVLPTPDNGYIVGATTWSFGAGEADAWLIKLNGRGTVVWQRTYGGMKNDQLSSLEQTSDSGIVISVRTSSFGRAGDAWVLKLEPSGAIDWQKTLGGERPDESIAIQQLKDGTYIMAGRTYSSGSGDSDALFAKLNSSGKVIWQKTIGGQGFENVFSMKATRDGGCILGGLTESFGGQKAWLIKLNSAGKVQWQRVLESRSSYTLAFSLDQTEDDGYIVAAGTASTTLLTRIDPAGNLIWAKYIDGHIASVQSTSDGGFVLGGFSSYQPGGGFDLSAWLLKTDSSGAFGRCPFSVKKVPASLVRSIAKIIPASLRIASPNVLPHDSNLLARRTPGVGRSWCVAR